MSDVNMNNKMKHVLVVDTIPVIQRNSSKTDRRSWKECGAWHEPHASAGRKRFNVSTPCSQKRESHSQFWWWWAKMYLCKVQSQRVTTYANWQTQWKIAQGVCIYRTYNNCLEICITSKTMLYTIVTKCEIHNCQEICITSKTMTYSIVTKCV